MNLLSEAGDNALNKWKEHPIGGEIRPEIWGQIFDARPTHKQAQNFAMCVQETHVTWLLDSGMFNKKPTPDRIQVAMREIQRMGYNFYVCSARIDRPGAERNEVELEMLNNGVAPFYYDWPLELAVLSSTGNVLKTYPVDWKLTAIKQLSTPHPMKTSLWVKDMPEQSEKLALRAINPLSNGKPLKFANATQDADAVGWITLGTLPK